MIAVHIESCNKISDPSMTGPMPAGKCVGERGGLASFVIPSQHLRNTPQNRVLSPLLFYRFVDNAGKFGLADQFAGHNLDKETIQP